MPAQASQLGDYTDALFNRGVLDLHMMVSLDGAERTEVQWRALLSDAGFALERIVRTRCPLSIIQAVPVNA